MEQPVGYILNTNVIVLFVFKNYSQPLKNTIQFINKEIKEADKSQLAQAS